MYWTPRSADSGRPRSRHSSISLSADAAAVDPPEEVVGRQEEQVAAAVAVALDQVVEPSRHVLGVAREHDQVVGRTKRVRRRECLEVLVAVHVDVLARLREPVLEAEVVAAVAVRDATVRVRAGHVDDVGAPAGVPGVAPAVAVGVVEVVGLPRRRRQHHGDALGRRRRDARRSARIRRGRRRSRAARSRRPTASPSRARTGNAPGWLRNAVQSTCIGAPIATPFRSSFEYVGTCSGPLRIICSVRLRRVGAHVEVDRVAGLRRARGERRIDAEHAHDCARVHRGGRARVSAKRSP